MKKLIFAILFLFACSTMTFAADVNLAWDAVPNATGYKVYMSIDSTATWDGGVDAGAVITYIYPTVIETGIVHFKVSAYNSAGESISNWRGAWYDHTKRPVDYPPGLGVQ